jgi:Domain of unknown function (DUF5753)/Helix-turn-helix domain
MTQARAATVLGCTQAKINHLELGRSRQQPDEVVALLRAYNASVEHVDRMTSLAGRADQGTWWAPFSDVLPDWFKTFVGLEGLASAEFAYGSKLLPGQLQTADYAAALLVGHIGIAQMDAPLVVRARMERQRLTDDDHPLAFRAVLEQTVIERTVGGTEVMRRQLEHLLSLMDRDNVEIHLMPTSVAVHDGLDGDFLLLDFEQAQSISYIGYTDGAIYTQEPGRVLRYIDASEHLCDTALSVVDTRTAIRARITELDITQLDNDRERIGL